MIRIMQSLGLDYNPAINSTLQFQKTIGDLNKQLEAMKSIALQSAKNVNEAFSSQLGQMNVSVLREMNKMYANLENQNKPIEIRVVTDKAENAMNNFAKSMGIKLDKNLKEQFKGLSDGLMTNFDQSKFDELASNISNSYRIAMEKQSKNMQMNMLGDSDDKAIYDYLNKATIKLDLSTLNAKNNVDGFSQAIRNLTKQSKDAGLSLDQMAKELEGQGISKLGTNTEDIAARMTKAVQTVRNGLVDLGEDVPMAEIEQFTKDSLINLITSLSQIDAEAKQATISLEGIATANAPLQTVNTMMDSLKGEVQGLGVVTTKTFKDMNNEVHKYINTYKNIEKGISISDTYNKNDSGGFDFSGRVVNDKSLEVNYKSIQTAHQEALKLNMAFDETIIKNRQLAQNDHWKKQFQNMTKTSDEIKALNKHYAEEEKTSAKAAEKKQAETLKMNKIRDQEIAKIKTSNIEQMKSQAASVQQRVATKGLSDEYGKQASMLREQLSVIQSRLQTEGKLTAEEVKQTNEIKEQLNILKAQTKTATADDIRENPSTLNQEFERRSSWFLTGAMFYGTINAAKEAKQTITDVEMGMVELARVMDDTSFVFDDYRDNLFKLGVDYGQTFDNVQSIALRWAQSGYNVADSLELTKTSLLALNTAELDATNATESMIGIMAQWQLQAEDMALVMDKINITADNYSVTSQDLVDGLLRSSSAAKNMNMTLDQTIGLLTVMREASGRTGKEVGSALNSILSYITRGKSIDTLESLGIKMFTDDTKSQFRNALEIFKDISTSWGSLSSEIQDGFVKSADDAGLFNEELANAIGIQEQWNDVQQRDVSQASAGVYRRNYFIGMIERMSNVQGVLNGMIDAEGYSMSENAKTMETLEKKQESLKISAEALAVAIGDAGLNGALKALADGGTNALTFINEMPEGMKDLVLATTTTFVAVKTLELGMKTFGIQLPGISQIIASLTSGTWSLTAALKAGGAGIATFATANAPLLAISAGIGAIVAVTNYMKKQREETEKAVEVFNQYKDTHKDLNDLISTYEDLAGAGHLTTEELEKLATTKQKIIDLLPKSKEFIDNENLSLSEQIGIVKELNDQELERLRIAAQKVLNKGSSVYEKEKKDLEELIIAQEKYNKEMAELGTKQMNKTATLDELWDLKELPNIMEKNRQKINELTDSTSAYENALKFMTDIVLDNARATEDNTSANSGLENQFRNTTKSVEDMYDKISTAVDEYDLFNQALKELNKEGKVSKSTLDKLIEVYPDIINMTGLQKDKMIELMNTSKSKRKQMIDDEIASAKATSQATVQRILNVKNESEALKELANIKLQMRFIDAGNSFDDPAIDAQMQRNVENARKALAVIEQTNRKIQSLDGLRSLFVDSDKSTPSKSGSKSKEENKALEEALKLLEHKKKMSVENLDSLEAEVTELKRINSLYAKSNDEKMDMAERIYAAEKRFMDRRLQDSVNWINDKKNMNELSADEEIAAWERVKNNQSDNVEAVKQATLNLYKLKNQVIAESFSKEENTIKHLSKAGILGVQQQIDAYKKLYETKADSLDDERSRVENLFSLYKSLLGEQKDQLKDAYDERMKQIDDESDKKKSAQDDVISGIEKEMDLLDRKENSSNYDDKMKDLKEQLAYWQVRTSEDARKKVAELIKQIDEAEHDREIELQKQGLEDKKKIAQDEIKSIEDTAKAEKEEWEKSYKLVEKAFDEHGVNVVALAATMSKEAYQEWLNNYITPMQSALSSGDFGGFSSIVGGLGDSISGLETNVTNSNNAQVYRLANQILELKRQYEVGGDKSAGQRVVSVYDELTKLNPNVSGNLHAMDYVTTQEYVKGLPKMHGGGKSLSYGAVEMMPGELTFPPGLSAGLERLFPLLSNLGKSNTRTETSSLTDNRREIKIQNLLNIENNHMEDDVDERSLSRELERQLSSLI